MKLKGIEIKPGMVILTKNARYVAFPTGMSDCPIAFANITVGEWVCSIPETFVEKIYDLITDGGVRFRWTPMVTRMEQGDHYERDCWEVQYSCWTLTN